MEYKSSVLTRELKYISDKELLKLLVIYFEKVVPDYFWTIPASMTGKYHPLQDQGEGGLVRHSRMVCEFAIAMLELDMWSQLKPYADEIYAACLIHDSWKLGDTREYVPGKNHTRHEHPLVASKKFAEFVQAYPNISDELKEKCQRICSCVETHMGQWTKNRHSSIELKAPTTPMQKFVHLCDYLASKKFVGSLDNLE